MRCLAIPHAESQTTPTLTISLGVAVMSPDKAGTDAWSDLFVRADEALYDAKANGRDQVAAARHLHVVQGELPGV